MRTLLSAVLAFGIALSLAQSPVEAKKKKAKNFKQREVARLVVLDSEASVVGTERVVTPGDVVLSAPIGVENAAILASDVSFEVAGYPASLDAEAMLRKSRVTGGELEFFGADARVYCDDPTKIDEKYRPYKFVNGKKRGGRRLDPSSTICLVDSDANDSFDRALLIGLNWKEDRATVEIPETGYRIIENEALPFSTLTIRFFKGALLQGPILRPDAVLLGQPVAPDGVFLNKPDAKGQKNYGARGVKRNKYPFELQFGEAVITMTGYETDGRKLSVRIDKGFKLSPMSFYFEPQVIYVYY